MPDDSGFGLVGFEGLHEGLVAVGDGLAALFATPRIESLAGFGTEIAGGDFFCEQRVGALSGVEICVQVFADVAEGVESAQIDAGDGAEHVPSASETVFDHGVDRVRVRNAFADYG